MGVAGGSNPGGGRGQCSLAVGSSKADGAPIAAPQPGQGDLVLAPSAPERTATGNPSPAVRLAMLASGLRRTTTQLNQGEAATGGEGVERRRRLAGSPNSDSSIPNAVVFAPLASLPVARRAPAEVVSRGASAQSGCVGSLAERLAGTVFAAAEALGMRCV